jgi:hypothetical protein
MPKMRSTTLLALTALALSVAAVEAREYVTLDGPNRRGEVVGYLSGTPEGPGQSAVVWDVYGEPTILPLPPQYEGNRSQAAGINDKGDIVGVVFAEPGF